VKYEHTPLHRTVTQLVDQLIPVPIPVANGNNSQRTPKAKGPRQGEGEDSTQKKRAPKAKRPPLAEGEGSAQKRRTPKAKRPAPEGENGEGSRKKRKTAKAPEAVMADGLEGGHSDSQTQDQLQPAVERASSTGFLNVPPAEAERRRQTAIELLMGRGIDPVTLSADQFNIFANQAPNLQSASLEMLAKYGAERLRIVHPDEKEQAGSSHSTPPRSQAANASPAPVPAAPPTTTDTPTQKPKRNKKNSTGAPAEVSIGNGAVVSVEQDGGLGTTESALKPKAAKIRKTRGRCDTCKQRQVQVSRPFRLEDMSRVSANHAAQCTKEHPSCSICIEAGVECVYLPPKPRRKSEKTEKSAEVVVDDEDDEGGEEPMEQVQNEADDDEQGGQVSAPELPVIHAVAPPRPVHDLDNEEFIPDPNILSGLVETHAASAKAVDSSTYYSSSHSGINFPQMTNDPTTGNTSMPELTYPQAQGHENAQQPTSSLGYSSASGQPQQPHHVPNTMSVQASMQSQRRHSGSATSRKSLPAGQSKETPIPAPAIPAHASNWNASPSMDHAASVSPNLTQQQATKRPKPRKSRAGQEPHGQAASTQAVAQAVAQATQYQSPMTRSPYQSAAHVSTRQGHRSQTNTPVATNSRPPPKAPSTNSHQSATNTSYGNPTPSTTPPNYDPYPRYNNNGTEQYTEPDNGHSSSRVTYESNSYQGNTATTAPASYSSTPSYDYSRGTGASNPLSQALNGATGYSGANNSATTQWPTSQTRSGQKSNSSSAYGVPATGTSSSQSYNNTRASDGRSSTQNTSYSQPQSQSYSSYSPQQQPNLSHQGQQNWYSFSAANNSNQTSYTNNRQSGYDSRVPDTPAYSGRYAGNDEQAIYELLRNNGSNH